MLANEVDNKAVQHEPVIYNGVDPEVSAGIDVVCRDIEYDRNEIVENDKYQPKNDGETESVAVGCRKSVVQVFGKEHEPEETAEHIGEVQEIVASVNEYAGNRSGATVSGVCDGVQYACAEREK